MSAGRNYLMLRGRREGDKKGGGRREEGGDNTLATYV